MRKPIKMTLQECPLRHLNQKVMEDNFNFLLLIENNTSCLSFIIEYSYMCV